MTIATLIVVGLNSHVTENGMKIPKTVVGISMGMVDGAG